MSGETDFVYRLILAPDWARARASGVIAPSDHDARDGFMHLSTRAQVLETARRYFAGRSDVLALEIKAGALADLRYEPSRNGEAFPHFYGELRTSAVTRALALVASGSGVFAFAGEAS